MLNTILKKVFGSKNEREIKRIQPLVEKINALEPEMQKVSDDGFRPLTASFRKRLSEGAPLDDLLPEAFAAAREAARRSGKMRHFDVPLIGGVVLHEGD